jgi:uncharacterized protein YukE
MPSWQPNWNDVNWNYGAAHDAVNELRRAASLLDDTADRRRRAADVARQEWRGRYRQEFDHELDGMLRRSRELADQMRRKAQQIEDASRRVQQEQDHRQRERDRWNAERREEERRERERREQEQRRP